MLWQRRIWVGGGHSKTGEGEGEKRSECAGADESMERYCYDTAATTS